MQKTVDLPTRMPRDLIFIRHGQSESNVVQDYQKQGQEHPQYDQVANRPDWQQRLTTLGINQAKAAGKYIEEHLGGLDSFDGCFVSPFLRARETAAYLGEQDWLVDDRIVERFRGVHGVESYEQHQLNKILEIRDISPWYSRPDWGESLQDVFQRYRTFQSSIRRHHNKDRVLVVSHGDFIKTARYAIEWLKPEQWEDADFDQDQTIPNGSILHYSRINPYNPTEISDDIDWVRLIDPSNPDNNQTWRQLNIKKKYSSAELLESVQKVKPIL